MQKIVVILGIVMASLLLSGCRYSESGSKKDNELINSESEGENDIDNIVLTEAEERILCELYTNEDRIREGKLYDYQLECLKQIRTAMDYLNSKYPNKNFEIVTCNPKNEENTMTTMLFCEGGNREELYDLHITEDGEEYRVADNYYKVLIREGYDTEVENLLQAAGFEKCIVYTTFSEVHGESVNGQLTAEEIFSLGNQLGRSTDIFIDYDSEKSDLLVEELKQIMESHNLYGGYIVYIKSGIADMGLNAEELKEYLNTKEAREEMKVVYFNCFDI